MRLSQPPADNAAPSECTAPEAAKARKHPCVAPAFSRRSSSTTPGRRACRCRSNSTATQARASPPPSLDASSPREAVVGAFAGDRFPADRASAVVECGPCLRCTTRSDEVEGVHVIAIVAKHSLGGTVRRGSSRAEGVVHRSARWRCFSWRPPRPPPVVPRLRT
jgi:hypothetical protein